MPNVPPKGIFGVAGGGVGLQAVDLVATIVGETTPRNVLEVWATDASRVAQLVWARDAESPSAATIAYASPNVNVSWTPLSPLRSDSYDIRRPDGSLAGTGGQNDVAFVDSAPKALSGAYTVTGVLGGTPDATPRSSNSLNLTTAPQTPAAAWSSPNVNVTWTAPTWGQPHYYHVYRNGVYQAQVVGTSLLWQDTNPPRGTQPTYTVYAVLSGTLSAGATTAAVNVPANVPTSVALSVPAIVNTLRLTWAAPAGTITGYEVERYVSSWAAHATYGTGTLSSDWTTTVAGYMRVRALSAGGASDWVQAGPATPHVIPTDPVIIDLYRQGGFYYAHFTWTVPEGFTQTEWNWYEHGAWTTGPIGPGAMFGNTGPPPQTAGPHQVFPDDSQGNVYFQCRVRSVWGVTGWIQAGPV